MARMYGQWRTEKQNSKGWTKRAKRQDEERQDAKDLAAEQEEDNG